MNKYQDALEILKSYDTTDYDDSYWIPSNKRKPYLLGEIYTEEFNTLQELIDYSNKQEELHFDEKENYITENELLKLRIKQFEKALDDACECLSLYDTYDDSWTTEEWKRWLLKDEQNI